MFKAFRGKDTNKQESQEPSANEPTETATISLAPHNGKDRVIRMFISSTFRDMHEERDELAKRIFPELRKMCEQRGVTWGEVDLRWGITDEQASEGQVLPICLEEIRNCRPYFLGILGERYGWVPDEINPSLIEREPWLEQHLNHSVTELEILQGVLNNPDMADHAFFYFRSTSYIDTVPYEEKVNFLECASEDEIREYGQAEADRRAQDRRDKLLALKDRIRQSGFPLQEDYQSPQEFGELVRENLSGLIDSLFPEESIPDPLEKERWEHEAFARSRFGLYIGRSKYFETLNEHAAGDSSPLAILGDSGMGKSALLANWSATYRKENPEVPVLLHFIGATSQSASLAPMLKRIMAELKKTFGIEADIPDSAEEVKRAFANWLYQAAAKGRCVIIVDALNQLADEPGALDLTWLPPKIPENIRLIVSTLPGRSQDEIGRREWQTLTVEPMTEEERKQLVVDYLAQYTRSLAQPQVDRLASSARCANPLYLRALLEEIRLWGEHETLGKTIEHYLTARNPGELYDKILERYEADYERDRPNLTRDFMSLIFSAGKGLSESELADLLGTESEPLPRAFWSPLFLAVELSIVNRNGLIGFFHDYLRQAIEERYLQKDDDKKIFRIKLADYFDTQDTGQRKIEELPWQLSQAKEWERLYGLLSDLSFLEAAWEIYQYNVNTYWAQIEESSSMRMVDAYRSVLDHPESFPELQIWILSRLLFVAGHLEETFLIQESLVKARHKARDHEKEAFMLGDQAMVLKTLGKIDEAMRLLKEQEKICRKHGLRDGLLSSIEVQAVLLKNCGELDEAMRLLKEHEHHCRESRYDLGLGSSLGNQALIHITRGELGEAMRLTKEQEQISRDLGDIVHLQASFNNQAIILIKQGALDEALRLLEDKEKICRDIGYRDGLQASLANQAIISKTKGLLDDAMRLSNEQVQICHDLGNRPDLQAGLSTQGDILRLKNDPDGALKLYKEQENICRDISRYDGLINSLVNQALIYFDRDEKTQSMSLLKEAEKICRDLKIMDELQLSLSYQANILESSHPEEAMRLLKEQESICRDSKIMKGLMGCLCKQAMILCGLNRFEEAMPLLEEQEGICRDLDDMDLLQRGLEIRATVLFSRQDYEAVLSVHQEQESICRDSGFFEDLAVSLFNQACIYNIIGRNSDAGIAGREAYQIARDNGLIDFAQQIRASLESFVNF